MNKTKERIALEDKVSALRSQCEEQVAEIMADAAKKAQQNEIYKGAEMTHDLYEAYIAAGFTEEQAWELVKIMLSNNKPH